MLKDDARQAKWWSWISLRLRRVVQHHGAGRWIALAGAVGVLCGIAGFVFNLGVALISFLTLGMCVGYQPGLHHGILIDPPARMPFSPLAVVPVVVLGSVVTGLVLAWIAPEAAGGGTGKAVSSFHIHRGIIRMRLTVAKLIASMVTIGTGGSAGREGPIALVGAGFASYFAQRIRLTIHDRRILLAAGVAGGVSSIFHAPLAAALFAAEVLYRGPHLEAEVIVPGFIASIVGFTVCGLLDNIWHAAVGVPASATTSLFTLPHGVAFGVTDWRQLAGYTLVAIAIAMASRLYVEAMRRSSHWLGKAALPLWARTGLGGLITAVLALGCYAAACAMPGIDDPRQALSILGPGYGILQHTMDDALAGLGLPVALLLGLVGVVKMLSTAATVGSGGAGGMFGPSLVIGGCLGGAVGIALPHLGHAIAPSPIACLVMGMAACLASTHRTPIAAILMVSEITGSYALLVPAMWVCGISFMLMGDRTIIVQQVGGPAESPAHRSHYLRELLAGTPVRGAIDPTLRPEVLHLATRMAECRRLLAECMQTIFPVIDDREGVFLGIVTNDDLRAAVVDGDVDAMVLVADLVAGGEVALLDSDDLSRALRRFDQHRLDELPMVDAGGRFVGLIRRSALVAYYHAQIEHLARDEQDSARLPESG